MSTLLLEHIDKSFGAQHVLQDVSLHIANGELVALLGPSGTGKSTILKLIAGLEQPDRGSITLDGRSLLDIPVHQRETVLMFQQAYLFPFLTVFDNIAFGLKARKTARKTTAQKVAQMLEFVELQGLEKRYPDQLSGGQQQRVALARALVIEPHVLMLDEPLSNLDPSIRASLQLVIRRIQQELKLTTLLVTHDRSEAFAMADRTALLLEGRLVACAPAEALFQRPPTKAAAQFLGIDFFLEGVHTGTSLETPDGILQVSLATSQTQPAIFAIRPEHIKLQSEQGPNCLIGEIVDVTYRGEYREYRIRWHEQLVTVRTAAQDTQFHARDHVWMYLSEQHLFHVAT